MLIRKLGVCKGSGELRGRLRRWLHIAITLKVATKYKSCCLGPTALEVALEGPMYETTPFILRMPSNPFVVVVYC
jgi:hypothetical protein